MISGRFRVICRAVFTTITALLLMFIFGNSAAEGEDSGQLSLLVTQWLNSALERMGIPLELSHYAVRKLAHFTEYSLLGASMTVTIWSWRSRPWPMGAVWLPLLCGGITAALDEWLQTFVPDRNGCVSDALLDFSGILWAALAASVILVLIERRGKRDISSDDKRAAE